MPGAGQVESIPASKRNFAVYKARPVERTYLVLSMSAVRKDPDPPKLKDHFQGTDDPGPTDKMLVQLADELAAEYANRGEPVELTLKVHGYNTRRKTFEWELLRDADPAGYYRLRGKQSPPGLEADQETFRPPRRFLVGFRWPSEGMSSRGSWRDTLEAILMTPTIGWALLLLPLAALLFSGDVAWSLQSCWRGLASVFAAMSAKGWGIWTQLDQVLPALTETLRMFLGPYRDARTGGVLLGVGLLFVALRLSTYPRDRYRALHYGVPDLGEFMRALEGELVKRKTKVVLDVVGHSMGSLVLINAFRVMSDYFSRPGDPSFGPTLGRNGTYELRTMVLCAPDLPAVMATPDRNNYFLSVLRRFRSLHIFSSDRDIILKWFSLLGNWISEPRHDMAGRRLGNVVLVRARPQSLTSRDSRADWSLVPVTRPVWRDFQLYRTDPLWSDARPAELHFHDCTCQPSMSGSMPLHLTSSSLLLAALWGLSRLLCPPPLQWLFWVLALFWGLGTVCRLAWPRLRDHGRLGGLSGLFADWTSLTMFLTFKVGWNPHSGYFMVGSPARRRIAGLLKNPELYPSPEEEDGPIRYRRVLVSV